MLVGGGSSASRASGRIGGLYDADVFESDSTDSQNGDDGAHGRNRGQKDEPALARSKSGPSGWRWAGAGEGQAARASGKKKGPWVGHSSPFVAGSSGTVRSAAVVAAHVGAPAAPASARSIDEQWPGVAAGAGRPRGASYSGARTPFSNVEARAPWARPGAGMGVGIGAGAAAPGSALVAGGGGAHLPPAPIRGRRGSTGAIPFLLQMDPAMQQGAMRQFKQSLQESSGVQSQGKRDGDDSAGFLVPRLAAPAGGSSAADEADGRAHNPFGENEEAISMLQQGGGVGQRAGLSRGASARSFAVEGAQEEGPSPVAEVDEEDDALEEVEEEGEDDEDEAEESKGSEGNGNGAGAASNPSGGNSSTITAGLPAIRTVASSNNMRVSSHGDSSLPSTGRAASGRSFLVDANPTSSGSSKRPRRQSMPGRTWVGPLPPVLQQPAVYARPPAPQQTPSSPAAAKGKRRRSSGEPQ